MSPLQRNINAMLAALSNKGLKHAVICPGSRNAPLIMGFARMPGMNCYSAIDERSAAFMALGMTISTGNPAAVVCTSGSAALNLYPAVAEAFYMQRPLIVITADRPPELIDRWDGQAIHQPGVYGPHVKASFNLPDQYSEDNLQAFTDTAMQAWEMAVSGVKGPVHINVPLREPLYEAASSEFTYPEFPDAPPSFVSFTEKIDIAGLHELQASDKIMVLNGAGDPDKELNAELTQLAQSGHCVVLSDIISAQHSTSSFANWETVWMNASDAQKQALKPEVLITTGKMILNKHLRNFLKANKPKHHLHVSENGYTADPFDTNPVIIPYRAALFFKAFNKIKEAAGESEYYRSWQHLSLNQKARVESVTETAFNELLACRTIISALPGSGLHLHLANSMSVRLASYCADAVSPQWRISANRGVSGIDGCTSTALGAALTDTSLHVLISGDLAFFYDVNAFLCREIPGNLKVVILNNSGGGIFRNIDGAPQMAEADPYLYTPHQLNTSKIAEHFRLGYFKAGDEASLREAISGFLEYKGCCLLEVFTDPYINTSIFNQYKNLQI